MGVAPDRGRREPAISVATPGADPPDVSIVVAAYNEEALLPRCLDAIAALDGPARYEVIVVDNGSTDRTAELARARPGVTVLHEEARGAVHAKAAGVAAARGAIVAILDADSICPPGWLTAIVARFAADPSLAGLSGPARYLDGPFWAPIIVWVWYAWWQLLSWLRGRAVYAVGSNVAFRRELYARSPGLDTRVLVGGDEVALFSALARVGRTRFDWRLVVETDARRLRMGFLRFSFSVVFLQYALNYTYFVLTGRSLLRRYAPGSTLAQSSPRSSRSMTRPTHLL